MQQLIIKQNNQVTTESNCNTIWKLYDLNLNNNLSNSLLEGRLHITGGYEHHITYLQHRYPGFYVHSDKFYVYFKDPEVLRICNANFSTDGNGCTEQDILKVKFANGQSAENFNPEDYIFRNNTKIKSFDEFYLFSNITTLPNEMFAGCTNLKSINATQINTYQGNGMSYSGTFRNCSSLEKIYMPKITEIGTSMFNMCTSLKYAVFPLVRSFGRGDYVFNGSNNLQYIYLGKFISTDGGDTWHRTVMFCGLTGLKVLDLGDQYTIYGPWQCWNCTNLKAIIIRTPDTVPQMQQSSTEVIKPISEDNGDSYKNAWGNTNVKFFVPDEMLSQYKSDTKWAPMKDYTYALSTFVLSDYIDFEIPEIGDLYST